jgi:hypothetical protein
MNHQKNILSFTLSDVRNYFGISQRTLNVCGRSGLTTLQDLLDYYERHGDFSHLMSAGRKTREELTKTCIRYIHEAAHPASMEAMLKFFEKLQQTEPISPHQLSPLQEKALDARINKIFSALSPRLQNSLMSLYGEIITYKNLYKLIINREESIRQIPNIGRKSQSELVKFSGRVRDDAYSLIQEEEAFIKEEYFKNEVTLKLSLSPDFMDGLTLPERGFLLFKILDKFLNSPLHFNKVRTLIIQHRMNWFLAYSPLSLNDIGEKTDLSNERVRQIERDLRQDIPAIITRLSPLIYTLPEIIEHYNIDLSKDIVIIEKDIADRINQAENTQFTERFIAKLFSLLQSHTHTLICEQFSFFQTSCLIKKELVEEFDFENFIGSFNTNISQRRNHDVELDYDDYLLQFTKGKQSVITHRLKQVCQNLILAEFSKQMSFNSYGKIVLHRNVKMQLWEYAYAALEHFKRPSTLNEIFEVITRENIMSEIKPKSLRSVLIKEKSHFICFGRTSTYGLTKWQQEYSSIKGGTIRDIAEEYLKKFNEPKHYYDITNYVLTYRPSTSPMSVHYNLSLNSKRFKSFKGGFWGLIGTEYEEVKRKIIPKDCYMILKSFIESSTDVKLSEATAYLSETLDIQSPQIRAWLYRKIKTGYFMLEGDNLMPAPQKSV